MTITKLKTLGELKASGYESRTIKQELRDNLITKLKKKENVFEGIWGYEETVIPDLERAILAGHDVNPRFKGSGKNPIGEVDGSSAG
jgi:magnesium chelatase subunit I